MKTIILGLILSSGLFVAAIAPPSSKDIAEATHLNSKAAITWENQTLDLGAVQHQVPRSVEFKFKNTGKAPLIISNVSTSCGCTVADFPKEPIMPGQKGSIKATYNAASFGKFQKTLAVSSNAQEGPMVLTITGEVK
jgi:hypothetical protein